LYVPPQSHCAGLLKVEAELEAEQVVVVVVVVVPAGPQD
jgi:hypothetical protein